MTNSSNMEIATFIGKLFSFNSSLKLYHWSVTGTGSYAKHMALDDFWRNIQGLDARFEEKRQQLEAEDKRFRFVAKMENGACEVGLQEVDAHHPFYELEGSNNIIMISTERYHEYPMIIKGYGAGADVTAAGVFADIISIANIR